MGVHLTEIFSSAYLASKVDVGDEVLNHVEGDVWLRHGRTEDLELLLTRNIEITPVEPTVSIPSQSSVVRTAFHNGIEVRQSEMHILVLFGPKDRLTEASQLGVDVLKVLFNLLLDATWLLQRDLDGLAK
jgi:hypothetical protein